jgi:hypothetical protein
MSRPAYLLSSGLGVLMLVQSLTGLFMSTHYRDIDWIKATWFGNDLITLVVAGPLLLTGLIASARGSVRGLLIWLGTVGYALYNYAFYLFGAALNVFFVLYVVAVVLAAIALILAVSQIDAASVAASFRSGTPVRTVGGCLVFVAIGLAFVWIGMWGAYVFAGTRPPVEPEIFKLVAALDLTLMVPALTTGGILLWRRREWGYIIAAVATIQASLYLLVLSVNSIVAVQRGFAPAPGELPIWAPLTILLTIVAVALLANARDDDVTVEAR